jgi:dolichol-phosphate mannosyltransferase
MPTYNEATNLERMAARLLTLDEPAVDLVVVDDASPDGTGQLADRLAAAHPGRVSVIHRLGKLGLGSAYLAGFRRALDGGAEYVFEMDADFSHPPEDVARLYAACQEADVAVGSRYAPGGAVDPQWSPWRKFLSAWGNFYARLVTGVRVRDATAGFKCFRRSALERLDLGKVRSEGYAFQVELAYACQRAGLRVVEVPIVFLDRSQGKSKMSARIVAEASWRAWQIRFRY